jgi:SdpC family antimicrobial peptide
MNAKKVLAAAAATAAVVAGSVVATSAHAGNSADERAVTVSAEDGRAVFAGVYFGQGEVGEQLASTTHFGGADVDALREANGTAEGRAATAAITDAVAERSPGFFGDLSSDMRSGDPRAVQRALARGAAQIKAVTREDSARDNGRADGTFVIVAQTNGSMYQTAGNAYTWATTAVVNDTTGHGRVGRDGAPLTREEAVAELAKALRAG